MVDSTEITTVATSESVAWIFPGQGSQSVGMGRIAAQIDAKAAGILAMADEILGIDLSSIMANGPAEVLISTPIQQPAILTASVAALVALRNRGALPDAAYVAGHSLGQYAAFVAAGSLGFADAIRLVRLRGELMERYGAGAMAAIIGMSPDDVAEVAADAGAEVANYNAPEQTTVSGEPDAVERAMALARERGAKRAIRLPVSGAFHSRLMASAAREMRPAIETATILPARIPVVTNVNGIPIESPDDVRRELLDHICAPVRWVDSVRWLRENGVSSFYEVGPGNVLAGLIARIDRSATVFGSDTLIATIATEEDSAHG